MIILGGAGTLYGPIIGAIIIVLVKHVASGFTEHWLSIMAVVYVLTAMRMHKGIIGWLRERRSVDGG